MQIFPKTKDFVNNGGFLEKNSLFSIKTTYAFLEINSNPEYMVLEKIGFSEKVETPALVSIMSFGSCHLSPDAICQLNQIVRRQCLLFAPPANLTEFSPATQPQDRFLKQQ